MALRDIGYQEDYRSGEDDLLADFFRPSLGEAKRYWRAVGYFSSSSLESFGSPLGEFLEKGGSIRLVTSVELSAIDLQAIAEGMSRQAVCEQRLEKIIEQEFADGVGDGVNRLIRLLEFGRLEIRIAVPTAGTGIYHEKVGVFFGDSDYVAFSGSSNESRNAFECNRECIDVFPSWSSPERAERKLKHFSAVWDGTDKGVQVYKFSEAAKEKLIRAYRSGRPAIISPQRDDKWRHQDEALRIFLARERGVLNMATGTGKTRTALKIVERLLDTGQVSSVVITMDGNDLLDQWYRELLAMRSILPQVTLYRDYNQYKDIQEFVLSPDRSIILVTRAAGTTRDPLVSALRNLDRSGLASKTLLIHDEVHRLGSPGNHERLVGLSDNVRFRLGLSATPDREYDQDGNEFIDEHIGPVLLTFGLGNAIQRGILVPFNYFPLVYEPTDEDRARIQDIYRTKAAREAAGDPMSDEEIWIRVARVYKASPAKLPVFSRFLERNSHLLERCIIFVETKEYGREVQEIVHKYRPDFHTYFDGDNSSVLQRFGRGDLECLITCHRLSEGIDIRSLNTVILFSSARARLETIQRIGRCLRSDPANPAKVANIVDFIRPTPAGEPPTADDERRQWLSELAGLRPNQEI